MQKITLGLVKSVNIQKWFIGQNYDYDEFGCEVEKEQHCTIESSKAVHSDPAAHARPLVSSLQYSFGVRPSSHPVDNPIVQVLVRGRFLFQEGSI